MPAVIPVGWVGHTIPAMAFCRRAGAVPQYLLTSQPPLAPKNDKPSRKPAQAPAAATAEAVTSPAIRRAAAYTARVEARMLRLHELESLDGARQEARLAKAHQRAREAADSSELCFVDPVTLETKCYFVGGPRGGSGRAALHNRDAIWIP